MTYYLLDFSGTNSTRPKYEELNALKETPGIQISFEYGMSLSSNPKAALDLYYNSRTTLTEELFREKLSTLFKHPPRISLDSPDRLTIRDNSVKQEIDGKYNG